MQCVVLVVLGLVALATASTEPKKEESYGKTENVHPLPTHGYKGVRYNYHGKYGGKCTTDGFYLNDENSFVICSNGNAYVQPCAPGTKNDLGQFKSGSYYGYTDFCSVNLNDYGYGAHPQPQRRNYGGPFYGGHYGGYPYGGHPYGGYNRFPGYGGFPYYWK